MGEKGKRKRRIKANPLTTKPVHTPTPIPEPAVAPVKEPAHV